MAEALGLAGLTPQEVNAAYAAFTAELAAVAPKVRLALANSLWADIRETLNPDFVAQNRATFLAELWPTWTSAKQSKLRAPSTPGWRARPRTRSRT